MLFKKKQSYLKQSLIFVIPPGHSAPLLLRKSFKSSWFHLSEQWTILRPQTSDHDHVLVLGLFHGIEHQSLVLYDTDDNIYVAPLFNLFQQNI